MRLLQVIATLDRAGAEGQLTRLCLELDRARFEPAVCCLTRGGPYEEPLRAAGVPVTILGKRGKYDLSVVGKLRRLMAQFQPDIVHTWLFTANTWGRVAGCLARRKTETARRPILIASERAADRWKGPLHRLVDRRLARSSAAIVANCDAVKRFCVESLGVPAEKVRVIHNGLNLALFDAAAASAPTLPLPERESKVRICAVARLEAQKGIVYLLEAMRRLLAAGTEAELWIVGDGPLRPELEAAARASPELERAVRFLGRRSDVPALLRLVDIFALPSLWEGLPNAVMEAMAAGLPVAATAVDGTPELVVEGETGVLAPPRSPAALAQALARLVADGPLRRRMGQAGRERIEREFSEERMVRAYEALYSSLAEEGPAR